MSDFDASIRQVDEYLKSLQQQTTSANVAGTPPARSAYVLRRRFGSLVDCIVPGHCGPAAGPSEIRDLMSGKVLRAGKT